jgi:hypothetical protein
MNEFPSGTVTFLFTDIEGSTKLAQEYPDAMSVMLARHHRILNQAIQAHKGFVLRAPETHFQHRFITPTMLYKRRWMRKTCYMASHGLLQ